MKRTLLKKIMKTSAVVTGLLIGGTAFGQVTVLNGQTVNASDNPGATAYTIQAGGTLNLDVTKNFTTITTTGTGTSTITGTASATATTVTVGAGNTLAVNVIVTTTNLATANLNDQTSSLSGTGTIDAGTVTINGVSGNNDATLVIGAGLTVATDLVDDGAGNSSTDYHLTVSGHLKIRNTYNGLNSFTINPGSTIEFSGTGATQAVPNLAYDNLVLSGAGAKTFSDDRFITGNFTLQTGVTLALGGSDLTINTGSARTATINGTLNLNGSGRLLKQNPTSNKTLILGPAAHLNLTYAGGFMSSPAEMPVFGVYQLATTSTVNYGAAANQTVIDIDAPGYGNLVVSGTSGTKTAAEALDIQGNFTLTSSTFQANNFNHSLKGNWIRNGGSFSTGTNNNSRISFTGGAAQTIGGTQSTTFRNITFANTAGGITLGQPISVSSNATFTSGVVTSTATNVLTFNDESTSSLLASNAATTSWVNGPVRKNGEDNFVFPIGGPNGFAPVAITGGNDNADAYTVQYVRALPADHEDVTAAGISHISACDYWTITENADGGGNTTLAVTFYWNANNPCGGQPYITSPSSVKMVRYASGSWSQQSTGTGTGSPATGSVIYTGLDGTEFTQFAFASTLINENPLPVVFGDVKAYEKNGGVQIEWANLTEKDVAEYAVERSANGKDFSVIATQLPSSNQNDKASYAGFDAAPNAGVNYYRIKATETTGKIVYSKILSVQLGKSDAALRLYPNPVSGNQVTVSLSNIKQGQYNIRVVNVAGQDIFRKAINNQSNNTTQTLDLPASIKPGIYNLIVMGDNYRVTKTFIVQ